MAWRFKASKYKNSVPLVPKIEMCVRDIVVGSYQTYGNNITASAKFMAFPFEHNGSSLAVLPIDDYGRKPKTMPLLHAHTDTVTDLEFSPFHDSLLATASQDSLVKIWHIPEEGLKESLSNAECTFSLKQKRVDTVGFHPAADCLLYSTASNNITLWDLVEQKEMFSNSDHPDTIQSLSWKNDGSLMATNSKDKMVRIFDARDPRPITIAANSHQSIKDSRVVWLGDQQRILTTGFDANRLRQVIIRDLRNFSTPEKSLELDCSTGILIPLFDADTNMLFLAGKGDITVQYLEVTDRDPFLIEGIRHTGEQTKGACLVPKRALKVMEAEVNRVLQLTSNSVIPIMYQVPRKTYRDFHSDIFPDTNGYKSELMPQEWMDGKNFVVPKMSLDPAKRENGEKPIIILRGNLEEIKKNFSNIDRHMNGSKNAHITKQAIIQPQKKDIIQLIETENAKSKAEATEFLEKFKAVTSHKNNIEEENDQITKTTDLIEDMETIESDNRDCINEEYDYDEKRNIPPKPLPRKSISEQSSFEEFPKPRPRITAGNNNYKPRLGPKPFSADASEISFDKVFSVPAVPKETKTKENEEEEVEAPMDEFDAKEKGDEPEEQQEQQEVVEEKEEEIAEKVEEVLNLSREDEQRKSIADRRKLYEKRSHSNVEEKKTSPSVVRRQETMKERENGGMANGKKNHTNGSSNISKRTSTVFGKVSKFRHLKGTTGHKSTHIENLRNISRQIPSECDVFHANFERVAVPMSGAGGKIAIFELSKTGRLADGVIPCLVNGSSIMDFQWDPFDPRTLAVACDDGMIKLWKIPEGGLVESTNTPTQEFPAHSEKLYFIKFHPLAKNVLLTASYDLTMKLWDLTDLSEKICLLGHTDQIYSFCWSPCGKFCATVCKDGKLRIYNPRSSEQPIKEGIGAPVGSRGSRITYALDGEVLVVTGFDKVSERQVYVFKTSNLNDAIGMISLDVSPALLIPYYDEDSSTIFLTGKGDTTIYAYEVTEDAPYLCPLSHHRCLSIHQGLSFLTKNKCDVSIVEFSKCYRLTNNSIEPLSFTVPRLKADFFQDDLFPPTRAVWEETLSSSEWFNRINKAPPRVSLQPNGMEALSSLSAPPQPTSNANQPPANAPQKEALSAKNIQPQQWSPEKTKKQEDDLKKAISDKLTVNLELEQDTMEGVDVAEWDE